MYETIPYDDICRLCISDSKSLDIFSSPPDLHIKYIDIIQTLIQITISESTLNELPKGICDKCANNLVQFYNFKIQTQNSQKQLLELLEQNLVDQQKEEQISETDNSFDNIKIELECEDDVLLEGGTSQFYEGHDEYETLDCEMNSSTNIVEYFDVSIQQEDEDLEELMIFKSENWEEYSNSDVEECELEDSNLENEIPAECVEKFDPSPKFELIENTEELPAEEQFLWQQKLAKWVTKLPRGKKKSLNKETKVKKVFQCETCDRIFSSKAAERNHQSVHTGEKNFECEICHKRFTRIYHVKDHLRIHQGILPYKCELCGKRFRKNSDLQRHKRIHSNKALYTCAQCGREFKWKTSYDIHLKSHAGIKSFKCTKCDNAYSSKYSLKKHQLKFNH